MKNPPDILEWLSKAEQDYQTAITMARKRKKPVPDVVGFHSQQCIEKYFKAFLVSKKMGFPKDNEKSSEVFKRKIWIPFRLMLHQQRQ